MTARELRIAKDARLKRWAKLHKLKREQQGKPKRGAARKRRRVGMTRKRVGRVLE